MTTIELESFAALFEESLTRQEMRSGEVITAEVIRIEHNHVVVNAGLKSEAYVPLDEALSRVVVDFSGRPGLHIDVKFTAGSIGAFDTQLAFEFFQGFVNHALVSLHIDNLRGENAHHQCETIFKAFGRALRMATELDERALGTIPSTKGSL